MIPVIVIEGATATGKTALALQLAEYFGTEIISADSRQVYKYLDIGTAKPAPEQLEQVKHHLISIINPDQSYNAGLFRKQASTLIEALHQQGKIPIVAGGTGLYIKALLEGLFENEDIDLKLRLQLDAEYQARGLDDMYDELAVIDPILAGRTSRNDRQRILRALEVYRSTGKTLTEHWANQEAKSPFQSFRILLDDERTLLYKRIDARIGEMINRGLLDEIKTILDKGYSWADPGFNSVGYKEFENYLEGRAELSQCVVLAQQHTRNYAKRQATWYNKCTFHLTNSLHSIILPKVIEDILYFFDIKQTEESHGYSCPSI